MYKLISRFAADKSLTLISFWLGLPGAMMPPIGLGNPLPIGRMGIGPPNSIGTGGLPGPMMPGPRFARVSDPFAPRTPAKQPDHPPVILCKYPCPCIHTNCVVYTDLVLSWFYLKNPILSDLLAGTECSTPYTFITDTSYINQPGKQGGNKNHMKKPIILESIRCLQPEVTCKHFIITRRIKVISIYDSRDSK